MTQPIPVLEPFAASVELMAALELVEVGGNAVVVARGQFTRDLLA
jgi:hypothetical protein